MSNKKIGIKRTLIKLIQMETTEFLRASFMHSLKL